MSLIHSVQLMYHVHETADETWVGEGGTTLLDETWLVCPKCRTNVTLRHGVSAVDWTGRLHCYKVMSYGTATTKNNTKYAFLHSHVRWCFYPTVKRAEVSQASHELMQNDIVWPYHQRGVYNANTTMTNSKTKIHHHLFRGCGITRCHSSCSIFQGQSNTVVDRPGIYQDLGVLFHMLWHYYTTVWALCQMKLEWIIWVF